jgi:hypothetical protein
MIIDNDFENYFHWEPSRLARFNPVTPVFRIYYRSALPCRLAGKQDQNELIDN